ncbi:hypothetical protein ACERK3_06930 [Phycisphaerales bacterium AB-hyl4]|uniref:DUF2892 family protein n=1 Tax=Natronomicrosphaera hydrolytica TaxID=3242702 RepID=A0ABV4U6C4_9BACT
MQCNIDARGRSVRLVAGLVTAAVSILLIALLLMNLVQGMAWWIVAIAAGLGGAFQIYEGWAGWCVLRAMGWRTPI